MGDVAPALAERLGWSPLDQGRLHQAAVLHDVGKALVPDDLLAGRRPLDPVEVVHVRQHAALGAARTAGVLDDEQRTWLRGHHERHDGCGYPRGRV